jgi:hypothetical protein
MEFLYHILNVTNQAGSFPIYSFRTKAEIVWWIKTTQNNLRPLITPAKRLQYTRHTEWLYEQLSVSSQTHNQILDQQSDSQEIRLLIWWWMGVWRIHWYAFCLRLGEGGHALVKRCYKKNVDLVQSPSVRRSLCRECAVKIFRTGDPEIINTIKVTFNNNRLLHESRHVVKAYDLYINERKELSHFVMEYCEFPSLESIIERRKLPRLIV